MNEARAALRRRVLKAGSILLAGGGIITCTVRNVSNTGVALEVSSPVEIPETFALILEMETRRRPCRVVWRKRKWIGVIFGET